MCEVVTLFLIGHTKLKLKVLESQIVVPVSKKCPVSSADGRLSFAAAAFGRGRSAEMPALNLLWRTV